MIPAESDISTDQVRQIARSLGLKSVPPPSSPDLGRAVHLDTERTSSGAWTVSGGELVHVVNAAATECACADFSIRRELCKHVLAVGLHSGERNALQALRVVQPPPAAAHAAAPGWLTSQPRRRLTGRAYLLPGRTVALRGVSTFLVVSVPPALMATFTAPSIGSLKGTSIRSRPCS